MHEKMLFEWGDTSIYKVIMLDGNVIFNKVAINLSAKAKSEAEFLVGATLVAINGNWSHFFCGESVISSNIF